MLQKVDAFRGSPLTRNFTQAEIAVNSHLGILNKKLHLQVSIPPHWILQPQCSCVALSLALLGSTFPCRHQKGISHLTPDVPVQRQYYPAPENATSNELRLKSHRLITNKELQEKALNEKQRHGTRPQKHFGNFVSCSSGVMKISP